jgi:hypothetical protein
MTQHNTQNHRSPEACGYISQGRDKHMKTVVARERESSPGGREGNRMKRKLMKVENTRLYPQQRHISNHSLRLYSSLSIENRENQQN